MYEEGNPLGLDYTTPINPLEALGGVLQSINGAVRYVPQALTNLRQSIQQEAEKFEAMPPTPVGESTNPVSTLKSYATGQERFEAQTMESVASGLEKIGVPTPIAGAGAAITGAFLPGPSDLKLTAAGGGMVLGAVTTKFSPILKTLGVETGQDIVTGKQGKRLIKRSSDIESYKFTIETKNAEMKALRELRGDRTNLEKYVKSGSKDLQYYWKAKRGNVDEVIKKLNANKKNAQEGLSRAQSNVLPFDTTKEAERIGSSDNVNYFRSTIGLSEKKLEESAKKVRGYLEQHHLFPKGMSAAFFGKMDDLISKGKAEKDDLILMAEYAVNQGRRTGDVKANLINMAKDPHNELHTMLRDSGAELKKSDYVNALKNVDDVDELLFQWYELLKGDAAYNIDTAKIWEPLDDLLKSIQKP